MKTVRNFIKKEIRMLVYLLLAIETTITHMVYVYVFDKMYILFK